MTTVTIAVAVAMNDAGYIAAGWIATLGGLGLYGAATVRRGRKLSAIVPAEERRWS